MKKCILPIEKKPIVAGYNHQAYITGVLGVEEDTMTYALADYINIATTSWENDLWLEFVTENLSFVDNTYEIYNNNFLSICKVQHLNGMSGLFFTKEHLFTLIENMIFQAIIYLDGLMNFMHTIVNITKKCFIDITICYMDMIMMRMRFILWDMEQILNINLIKGHMMIFITQLCQ